MKKTANSGRVFVSVLVLLALAGPVWAFEDSNLVSHWRFDEGSETTAYDTWDKGTYLNTFKQDRPI